MCTFNRIDICEKWFTCKQTKDNKRINYFVYIWQVFTINFGGGIGEAVVNVWDLFLINLPLPNILIQGWLNLPIGKLYILIDNNIFKDKNWQQKKKMNLFTLVLIANCFTVLFV